jgi:hypothetical protein
MAISVPWVIPPTSPTPDDPATLRWSVAGLIMDNATPDTHGVLWLAQVDGWNNGADVRPSRGSRPGRDGDWQGQTYLSGRTLVAHGACFAPDRLTLRAARDRFMAAVAPRHGIRVVSNEVPARSVLGEIDAQPLWTSLNESQASFSVSIHAESPFKQGQVLTSSPLPVLADSGGLSFPVTFPPALGGQSAIEITPDGNTDSWPTLIITGPMTNPVATLVETGQIVAYNLTIARGQQLIVDTDTGVALLGQTLARGAQSLDTDFFPLAPGTPNTVRLTASSTFDPAASLIVSWVPNWN